MTVTVRSNRVEYTAAAGQTLFPFDFRILSPEDLRVTRSGSDQILNSQYHVYGVGVEGGGYLVLTIACSAGEPIIIRRLLPIDQPADYVPHDSFPADSHELQLDRGAMIDQQLQEQLNRCLQLNNVYSFGKGPLELPYPPDGQNRYVIAWNEAHSNLDTFLLTTQTGLVGDMVPSSPLAGFPAAGNAGRLRRATDNVGGLWVDHGTRWAQTAGQEQNAAELMVGDDATDNAAALTQLLANLPTGATLKIPVGTYRINAQLVDVLKSHITIKGDGMGRTYLHFTMPLPTPPIADLGEGGYALFKQTTAVDGVTFEDLSFTSNISVATVEAQSSGNVRGHNAVYLAQGNDISFRRCEIWNWGGRGFWVGNATTAGARMRVEGCYAHDTWSDFCVANNIDGVWYLGNYGANIKTADSNHDGLHNSQFADFCVGNSSRYVHFLGNQAYNILRVAYLAEGTVEIPSAHIVMSNNIAVGCGWGCPSGSGSAVWLENTTGRFTCSDFLFLDCEMSFIIARENNHIVRAAMISNGTCRLTDHAKTTGKSDSLYGCIQSRAEVLNVNNVLFEQNGTSNNGFHTFYLMSASTVHINHCQFVGTPSRANIILDYGTFNGRVLSITQCDFSDSASRLLTTAGTGTPGQNARFLFTHNVVSNNSASGAGNYLISHTASDVVIYADFSHNTIECSGSLDGIVLLTARTIHVAHNTLVGSNAAMLYLARFIRFESVLVQGNSLIGPTTQEKLSLNASTAPYPVRMANIQGNTFAGASPDHVDLTNQTSALLRGNQTMDATSRAFSLTAPSPDVYVDGNMCAEATLINPQSDTIVARNWVAGAPQPALSQNVTIPSGSTSAVVTHNLPFTPNAADLCIVRSGTQPTNPVTHFWISTTSATTFTVNCNADPGANGFTFSWQCVRH